MRLERGDCLALIRNLADKSIDLVVTDPPYKICAGGVKITESKNEPSGIFQKRHAVSDGTAIGNKWLKKGRDNISYAVRQGKMFKHNDIKFSEWLPEVYRVLKDNTHCYIMVNGRNLAQLQHEAERVGFRYLNLLAWVKNNSTPNKYYMQSMEFVLLLRKGYAKAINNMGYKNYFNIPNIIGNKKHPTEKPIDLLKIFIENSSNLGDIVLDPFTGSGSTGLASLNTGRKFIGFEIDDSYYDIAQKRLNEHISPIESLLETVDAY